MLRFTHLRSRSRLTAASLTATALLGLAMAGIVPTGVAQAGMHCITGAAPYYVIVNSGESVCLDGASATNVYVYPGGEVKIKDSTLAGQLWSHTAKSVKVCNSTVTGGINIMRTAGPVVVGDPANACPGNTIGSGASIYIQENTGGFRVEENTVPGYLTAQANTGGSTGSNVIKKNTVGVYLICSENTPSAVNEGMANTAAGKFYDCAGL